MSNIVRAWKDETYRQSLSVEEQAVLPANPAGEVELTDAVLEGICGAWCGNHDGNREGNREGNRINQDVDQTANATFGDKNFVFQSWIDCDARNKADLDATIKNKNFEL